MFRLCYLTLLLNSDRYSTGTKQKLKPDAPLTLTLILAP